MLRKEYTRKLDPVFNRQIPPTLKNSNIVTCFTNILKRFSEHQDKSCGSISSNNEFEANTRSDYV